MVNTSTMIIDTDETMTFEEMGLAADSTHIPDILRRILQRVLTFVLAVLADMMEECFEKNVQMAFGIFL